VAAIRVYSSKRVLFSSTFSRACIGTTSSEKTSIYRLYLMETKETLSKSMTFAVLVMSAAKHTKVLKNVFIILLHNFDLI
jgi:hypothetical protein